MRHFSRISRCEKKNIQRGCCLERRDFASASVRNTTWRALRQKRGDVPALGSFTARARNHYLQTPQAYLLFSRAHHWYMCAEDASEKCTSLINELREDPALELPKFHSEAANASDLHETLQSLSCETLGGNAVPATVRLKNHLTTHQDLLLYTHTLETIGFSPVLLIKL